MQMKLLAFRVCEHDSNFSFYDGKELKYFKSERLTKIKHHAYDNLLFGKMWLKMFLNVIQKIYMR